jgi:hypothetical protein
MSWRDHSDTRTARRKLVRSRIGFSTQTGFRRKAGPPTRARKGTRPALCCVKNGVRLDMERGGFRGLIMRCGLARPLE